MQESLAVLVINRATNNRPWVFMSANSLRQSSMMDFSLVAAHTSVPRALR